MFYFRLKKNYNWQVCLSRQKFKKSFSTKSEVELNNLRLFFVKIKTKQEQKLDGLLFKEENNAKTSVECPLFKLDSPSFILKDFITTK